MKLQEGAFKIVASCAGVKSGENVLVITDCRRPESVATELARAAEQLGAQATILRISSTLRNGEPDRAAAAAICAADVVLAATTRTLGHSAAVREGLRRGARVIALTECCEETLMTGAIEADFSALSPVVDYVRQRFDAACQVHVTAPGGTDLRLDISQRYASVCSGVCHEPGTMIGVPDVEVYVAPIEDSTQGTLVVDATCSTIGRLARSITLRIEKGVAKSVEGGDEAEKLAALLQSASEASCLRIAEFALGLNPMATLTGNIIVDEGAYGTGHFALGKNTSFGGANDAPLHIDLVYLKPTICLDDELLMQDGTLTAHGHLFPDLSQFRGLLEEQVHL